MNLSGLKLLVLLIVVAAACGGATDSLTVTTTSTPSALLTPQTVAVTPPAAASQASTTTTLASTTTTLSEEQMVAAEFEADVRLIVALHRGYSDSWFGGNEAGVQFIADHNYYHTDFGECFQEFFPTGPYDDFIREVIIDADTIERDDEWVIPQGSPSAGIIPNGRVYIMTATTTSLAPPNAPSTIVTEVHATITDGEAKFFIRC